MDHEKAIDFLLRQQARSEARADTQMAAIRKLIQTGMKLVVKNEQAISRHEQAIARNEQAIAETNRNLAQFARETRQELKDLAAAQKRTDATLHQFIRSMQRGGNGSSHN